MHRELPYLLFPPPYRLEHDPRLSPAQVARVWRNILEICPRFKVAEEDGHITPPRVAILPGVGDPIYDSTTRTVLATLFPIEVRLHTIIGALGEAYLDRDPDLEEGYRLRRGIAAGDRNTILERFHRDFILWYQESSEGQRVLEAGDAKWFHMQLVARRSSG